MSTMVHANYIISIAVVKVLKVKGKNEGKGSLNINVKGLNTYIPPLTGKFSGLQFELAY